MKYIKLFEEFSINEAKNKMPNSLLNYMRCEEFKTWFGDWEFDLNGSSKIVENGFPMVVYHGAKVKFDEFDENKQVSGWLGKGFYFADNKKATKDYGNKTIVACLNIRNPYMVKTNQSQFDIMDELRIEFNDKQLEKIDYKEKLMQNGYDGIIFNHHELGLMICCFKPNQIKIVNDYIY
jgi:hypothetical protein